MKKLLTATLTQDDILTATILALCGTVALTVAAAILQITPF